jgi:phage protein U
MATMNKTKTPDDKKIRLTLDVTPEFYERLEALERKTEAGSKANLIRQALQLYEYFVIRTIDEGKEVIVRTPPKDDREKRVDIFPQYILAARA